MDFNIHGRNQQFTDDKVKHTIEKQRNQKTNREETILYVKKYCIVDVWAK